MDEDVIRKHQDMVYRLAYAKTKNISDADDIFQEVFLRYMKNKPIFHDDQHEKAWFIRVTVNCSNTSFRNILKRKQTVLSTNIGFFDKDNLALEESLKTLTKKERVVIHLYYYEGYSLKEISELLNSKESTIRMRLLRSKEKLRMFMKGEEDHV